MKRIPVAVQMYTLREECAQDFTGTIAKVADMGYDGVEFAGFYGLSAEKVKELLDQHQLQAAGSHVGIDQLVNDFEQVVQVHKTIGCQRIVCPSYPENKLQSADDYKRMAGQLDEIGRKCRQEGFTFAYHNHAFELKDFDGKTGLQILFDESNPEWVHAELDIYWLKRGGEDPVQWMKRYGQRATLIHLKDMTTDGEQFFAELGTGGLDLVPVLEQSKQENVEWWIVEQDQSKRSALESVEMSYNYLKENNWI